VTVANMSYSYIRVVSNSSPV